MNDEPYDDRIETQHYPAPDIDRLNRPNYKGFADTLHLMLDQKTSDLKRDAMTNKYGPGMVETKFSCFKPEQVFPMILTMLEKNNHVLIEITGGLNFRDGGVYEFKVYSSERRSCD